MKSQLDASLRLRVPTSLIGALAVVPFFFEPHVPSSKLVAGKIEVSQEACEPLQSANTLHDLLRVVRTVPLSLPDTVILGSVDNIRLSPGSNMLLVDRADYNVKVFDDRGNHLRTLGGRGERPGQFLNLADAAFFNDSVVVAMDDGRLRLIMFDLNQGFLYETAADIRPIGSVSVLDTLVVVAGFAPMDLYSQIPDDAPLSVQFLNQEGQVVKRILTMPPAFLARPQSVAPRIPLLAVTDVRDTAVSILVTWRLADQLLEIDLDGNVLRAGRLPETDHFVSANEVIDTFPGTTLMGLLRHTSPIVRLIASRDLVVVGYFPAFRGETAVRYNVYNRRLDLIVQDMLGPGLYESLGDTLIALRRNRQTAERQHELVYLVACPALVAATH